ncbi:MAG TPA: hypothetical protein VKW04_08050 [Planctomycetota bacterium]|nr:hypothetical protein [Planctomycetota bacterium]
MGHLLLGFALGLVVQAQDDPKGPAADLAAALQATAKRGAFAFTGTLKTEVDPDDADDEATSCSVSGAVAPGERTVAHIKGENSVHDLLLKRRRLAGRETWKGHPLDLMNAPSELMSLLDLERLAMSVKDAASVKALPEEKIGTEDCRVYELGLSKGAIRSYHDEAEAVEEEEKSLQGVTLTLKVQKSDGLVVTLDASVLRLYKDDKAAAGGTKGLSVFQLRLKDFGTAKVPTLPGLEALLKD